MCSAPSRAATRRDKRARSLLDFDDLIERLAALLRDTAQGPWVQYKLDAGIIHILVDESQDTNAEQWEVVNALAREFFAGAGQVERLRTLFAVGDGKQSIYSFQGADPSLFGASGRDFAERARAVGAQFTRTPLHTSFRTLPGVLEAVDLVFDRDDMRDAVLADAPVRHFTARSDRGRLRHPVAAGAGAGRGGRGQRMAARGAGRAAERAAPGGHAHRPRPSPAGSMAAARSARAAAPCAPTTC